VVFTQRAPAERRTTYPTSPSVPFQNRKDNGCLYTNWLARLNALAQFRARNRAVGPVVTSPCAFWSMSRWTDTQPSPVASLDGPVCSRGVGGVGWPRERERSTTPHQLWSYPPS
jgi:hypothetical protein